MAVTTFPFNGRNLARPQAITRVDATQLDTQNLAATGSVTLIGEAVGGRPVRFNTDGLDPAFGTDAVISPDDVLRAGSPTVVSENFRGGDLLNAGNIVFNPSADPLIPGGAADVVCLKVNPSTRSSTTLQNTVGGSPADIIDLLSDDYGAFTEQISTRVSAGTNGGKLITTSFDGTVETQDDVGATGLFSLNYDPGTNGYDTATVTVTQTGNISVYATKDTAGAQGAAVTALSGASVIEVLSSSAADTSQTVTIYGLDGSGDLISESVVLAGTTEVPTSAIYTTFIGALLSATTAGTVTIREEADSSDLGTITTGNLTLGLALHEACFVQGSKYVAVSCDTVETVFLRGLSDTGVLQTEVVAVDGTNRTTSALRWSQIDYVGTGDVPSTSTITLHATAFSTKVTSEDTLTKVKEKADALVVVDSGGLTAGFTLELLTGATLQSPANLDEATEVDVHDNSPAAELKAEVQAIIDYYNISSQFVDASLAAGLVRPVWTVTATVATTNAQALLMESGAAGGTFAQVVTTGTYAATPTAAQAASALVDAINRAPQVNGVFSATLGSAAGTVVITGLSGNELDVTNSANTSVADTTAAAGARTPPDNQASPVFLSGGSEGVATIADYQAAFQVLRQIPTNTVVVLTADPAIHAELAAHCEFMATFGKGERDGIVGLENLDANSQPLGTLPTKAQIKSQIIDLNSRHIRTCCQAPARFNTQGILTEFPTWMMAVLAAGMQASAPLGEPLTNKLVRMNNLKQANDWNTVDDGDELILAGAWLVEAERGVGFRALRDSTTNIAANNLAYTEASVNRVVNFVAAELRTTGQAFAGRPGTQNVVNLAVQRFKARLGALRDAGVITAFQSPQIRLTGDILDVTVLVSPTLPINFVPITAQLQLSDLVG